MNQEVDEQLVSELLVIAEQLNEARVFNRLVSEYKDTYENGCFMGPYDWQVDMHNASLHKKQRGLISANRVGKTRTGGRDVAMHATGRYPDWYKGKRFDRPTKCLCGSITNKMSRDISQKELLGDISIQGSEGNIDKEGYGTGAIPKECLPNVNKISKQQCGISNVVDVIRIFHISGGYSTIQFKTYEQGRDKWQGDKIDVLWLDEEPPQDIYTEAVRGTSTTGGVILLTATPLKGMSKVVRSYMRGGETFHCRHITVWQAPHITDEMIKEMKEIYPEHEWDARLKGIPMMGEGVVFPISEDKIKIEPFEIPEHFRRIGGMDFGIDHYAASVWLAHDADTDIIYVYNAIRQKDQSAVQHAATMVAGGKEIPFAWPHDGANREKGSGKKLIDYYRDSGVNANWESARYEDNDGTSKGGGQPVEPIVVEMYERMKTGRFKVFGTLYEWFEEFRLLHRENGKIIPIDDDLLKATMYALMDLRYAVAPAYNRIELQSESEFYNPFG